MPTWKNYYLAHSVADALNALMDSAGEARPIAGGTDLLLDLQQGRHPPIDTLVDLTHIPEMCLIEAREDHLFIGAALPLNKVVESEFVGKHAPALVDAASLIGGPQVRNTATLGGNVGHALPAADGTISLLALGAHAEVASLEGRCVVPLGDLFRGPGKSTLDTRREILVGFKLPLRKPGQSSAFRRIMRPQGVAIAILNLAIWLERAGQHIQDIRISIGPAGPTPLRAQSAENVLRGRIAEPQTLDEALTALLAEAHFRTSPHRSTEAYRKQMAGVLLKETFEIAWKRALDV
jgi:carbon-monoxide dehydrogenase medium subunit